MSEEQREPLRMLVFSASLRQGSLNRVEFLGEPPDPAVDRIEPRRGATEEVADALGVAILMNGGPGTVHAPRAFEALREFNKQ